MLKDKHKRKSKPNYSKFMNKTKIIKVGYCINSWIKLAFNFNIFYIFKFYSQKSNKKSTMNWKSMKEISKSLNIAKVKNAIASTNKMLQSTKPTFYKFRNSETKKYINKISTKSNQKMPSNYKLNIKKSRVNRVESDATEQILVYYMLKLSNYNSLMQLPAKILLNKDITIDWVNFFNSEVIKEFVNKL